MVSEVVMPQMGADMEEGTIVRWLKHEGDEVKRGEIIAEIETDKANVEIEAFESGVFRKVLAAEGDTVAVGTVIGLIASAEEDISQFEKAPASAPSAAPPDTAAKPKPKGRPEPEQEPAPAALPTETAQAATAAPAKAPTDGRIRASPVARKLAEERGVDLSRITGSGPDGRIVRRDVEAAAAPSAAPAPAPGGTEVVAMSRVRQTIARRMAQSKREAPHYYLTVDIDMSDAERLRRQINEVYGEQGRISINDLIVKATAMALQSHPAFNATIAGDEVRRHGAINVCIAIALDDGLIAPAVLDCGGKSLIEIARASKSLVDRAKSGALKPEEYSGGTFTVSNLGPYDIETLIAIIQPPQTAILGVGSVLDAPAVRDGQVVAARLMKTVLSADHRVTDGAQGAQFLNEIRKLLENPAALLLGPPA